MAELDEDLLRPLADDVDLVDVGYAEQALADVLGARLEVGEAHAVGAEHIESGIDVAVLVVEVGAGDARRQLVPDVADLLAHLVPELLHSRGRGLVRQVDADEGHARLRIALDAVEIGKLLQLLLDLVGDLRLHLGRGRAGPGHVHDHGLDREGRVLGAAEIEIRIDAGRAEDNDHEQDQRPMRDRPFRQIESLHDIHPERLSYRASTLRTLSPGSSFCTPSVTILSPSVMPPVTSAASSVNEATVTGRTASMPASSTT